MGLDIDQLVDLDAFQENGFNNPSLDWRSNNQKMSDTIIYSWNSGIKRNKNKEKAVFDIVSQNMKEHEPHIMKQPPGDWVQFFNQLFSPPMVNDMDHVHQQHTQSTLPVPHGENVSPNWPPFFIRGMNMMQPPSATVFQNFFLPLDLLVHLSPQLF